MRNEQNGGDMNESEFWYRQLEMWTSLRRSSKESLDRLPIFTPPCTFYASPCNVPRYIPGTSVQKILILTIAFFRRVRIPADRLLGLRTSVRNVQNRWTDLHEIIDAPSHFPSSSSNTGVLISP